MLTTNCALLAFNVGCEPRALTLWTSSLVAMSSPNTHATTFTFACCCCCCWWCSRAIRIQCSRCSFVVFVRSIITCWSFCKHVRTTFSHLRRVPSTSWQTTWQHGNVFALFIVVGASSFIMIWISVSQKEDFPLPGKPTSTRTKVFVWASVANCMWYGDGELGFVWLGMLGMVVVVVVVLGFWSSPFSSSDSSESLMMITSFWSWCTTWCTLTGFSLLQIAQARCCATFSYVQIAQDHDMRVVLNGVSTPRLWKINLFEKGAKFSIDIKKVECKRKQKIDK